MIITTDPRNDTDADLQEVAAGTTTLFRPWARSPGRSTRSRCCTRRPRLRARLARTLANLHNLIAAARATLSAHADGEDDALYYLRDELEAQDQLRPRDRERP